MNFKHLLLIALPWLSTPSAQADIGITFDAPIQSGFEAEGALAVVFRRSGDTTQGTVTVDYTVTAGTAEAGKDFVPKSGRLTFPPGAEWFKWFKRSQTITVQLLDDTELEFDETITVTLSNPTGGATFLNGQQMQVTILDDEWAATILENKLPLFDDNFRFYVSAVAVQPDGKVLLGGYSYGNEGPILEGDPADVGLIRLNADLSRDLTFKAKLGGRYLGFPAEGVLGLALQLDRRILVSTTSWVEEKAPGTRVRPGLTRLYPDGSVDWNFNVLDHFRAVSAGNFGSAPVVPLSDGAILAAGWFETSESDGFGGLVRLKSDGSLDPTFIRFPSMPERFSRQSDGKIILVVAET